MCSLCLSLDENVSEPGDTAMGPGIKTRDVTEGDLDHVIDVHVPGPKRGGQGHGTDVPDPDHVTDVPGLGPAAKNPGRGHDHIPRTGRGSRATDHDQVLGPEIKRQMNYQQRMLLQNISPATLHHQNLLEMTKKQWLRRAQNQKMGIDFNMPFTIIKMLLVQETSCVNVVN